MGVGVPRPCPLLGKCRDDDLRAARAGYTRNMSSGASSFAVLSWVCSFFAQAGTDVSSQAATASQAATSVMMGSIRAIEGSSDGTTAVLQEFDRTKRLEWAPGPAYVGVALDEVVATFRIEGTPAARGASVAIFEKLASIDPTLQRPPTVLLTARGSEYRGVVESLSYQCTSQRCDVKVAVLQGKAAAVRRVEDEEGWVWGARD
jgi:hypothetical protein